MIKKKDRLVNNKAFSIIELIVVVLIMAIVAVMLAPQVMKWVSNSRVASDLQTKANIEGTCALAITNDDAFDKVKDGGYEIIITRGVSEDQTFEYKTKNDLFKSPEWPNVEEDAFWRSFLEVGEYTDFRDFEDDIKIKTVPAGQNVVMRIIVYEGGCTYSLLTGVYGEVANINNNPDIELET